MTSLKTLWTARHLYLGLAFAAALASGFSFAYRLDTAGAERPANAYERGQRLFTRYQCISCHRMGDVGYTDGVDLCQTQGKLRPDWLRTFLKSPAKNRVRHMDFPMPVFQLTDEEVEDLVAFLTNGVEDSPATSHVPDADRLAEGKVLFQAYGCASCHRVGSESFGTPPAYYQGHRREEIERMAPDLHHIGRLNRSWAIDFMEKPGRFLPGTPMFNNGAGRGSLEKIYDYLVSTSEREGAQP